MKPSFIRKEIIAWLIILLPFIFVSFYWGQLPDRMPTHWNFNGQADNYSSKGVGTLLIPFINLGIYFLLLIVPRIDPKKENFAQFETAYRAIRLVVHSFLSFIFILTILSALQYPVNMKFIVQLSVPLLFIVLGSVMGKIQPNYMVGIRTPWTLANGEVWKGTHRMTGRLWVAVSFIYFCIILFSPIKEWMVMVYIAIMIAFPLLYSYLLFRRIVKEGN